jgi:hypothetical protein
MVEMATDPFVNSSPGFSFVDPDHIIWGFASSGGEVGDMCEADPDSYGAFLNNFYVQRTWSNVSVKAGHDPCVPPLGKHVYFAAAPVLTDKVTLSFGPQMITTLGVKIPVGQMATIDVDLWSDAAKNPWTVSAEQASTGGTSGNLSFAFDTNMGQNGDVLHLTITSLKTTQYGAAGFAVISTDGAYTHKWYGLVAFQ